MAINYPFSAIAGQDDMRRALMIAAIDPGIGGVMVFGDRGTGKSTAVRALADLLPPDGDTAVPVVDLPLGATEDRVVGALDLERALVSGEKAFEPGLLAKAHGGFLYIDEINLLDDHVVDLLLDVAASGENIVEREGLSVRHPAKFVLVGSGNPEEGELRPQLLDRFGLSVEVRTPTDIETRVTVIKRRAAFDADPAAFVEQWLPETEKIRGTIVAARERLGDLARRDDVIERAARLCMALGTDGLRGEMTLMRAATALAALDGSETVDARHIDAIAPSVLRHRLRRNPLDEAGSDARIARAIEELASA
jgi:magnesium chelatase subunit I